MKYNLQFFADENVSTGAEVSAPAEQTGTVSENVTTEATEGSATPEGANPSTPEAPAPDMNAIFANARRRAEAEFKQKQAARDAEYARRFGNFTNPETGKPIQSEADYLEALDAQERVKAKAELESKGIDYGMIDRMINNSPQMREAQQVIQEMKAQKVEQAIQNDLAELNKMDASITSLETVPADVIELATKNGFSLVNAYKIANFGKVSAQQTSAIQQRTINQISGKAHLAPVNGVVQNSNEVEIPADQLASWKEWYPNLSASELRKKYNRVLNAH
jgi:hypothetical protein